MALTPGVTLAGPLNSPLLKQSTTTNSPAASQSAQKKGGSNQEIANKIAAALKKAKLSGYEIEISVEKGVATLDGMVGSPAQREAAAKVVGSVSGISRVNNRLGVGDSAPRMPAYQAPVQAPPQAAAMRQAPPAMPRAAARPQMVHPANYQQGYEGQEPIQQPLPPQPMGQMQAAQMAGPPAGMPAYGPPSGGATNTIYNQPNFPNYSWPTYAQYPNYAAVTYPSQYAASAWPYIGPFYPYPQVPLGWRKAQLEWDDGYWNLNFRPRTERWWWFLDPKNW
jgi:hypothetical protein